MDIERSDQNRSTNNWSPLHKEREGTKNRQRRLNIQKY